MGTKVLVASSVYNLAGDIHKRPNVLKTTVLNAILSQSNKSSIGSIITKSYLNGAGISLKRFSNWAESSGYNDSLGVLESSFSPNVTSNSETILSHIPHASNETLFLDHWVTNRNDVLASAVNYIKANNPSEINTAWTVEYLEPTNTVRIYWIDNSFTDYIPTDFLPDTDYLVVYYSIHREGGASNTTLIDYSEYLDVSGFPSVIGWTLDTDNSILGKVENLNTKVTSTKVYSDGRPDEITVTNTGSTATYDLIDKVYLKHSYYGGTDTALSNLTERIELKNLGSIEVNSSTVINPPVTVGSVTYVETVLTEEDILVQTASSKLEHIIYSVVEREVGNVWIYEYGSGYEELDDLFGSRISSGTLYPFIPIRIDNQKVTPTSSPVMYPKYKKAFYKATGNRKFNDFIDSFEESESIGEMDYIYISFGVSLNTLENAGKKYIYHFFKQLYDMGATDVLQQNWLNLTGTEQTSLANYNAWWHSHALGDETPMDSLLANSILRGSITGKPRYYIVMGTNDRLIMNYRMHIEWSGINETFGSGLAKPNAKVGELWVGTPPVTIPISGFSLIWQYEANAWKCITVSDLHHKNFVYRTSVVDTWFQDALDDEEESGFIIPLQKSILSNMGIVDVTQLNTSCMYAVINSYQIYKEKWYETSLFKVVLVIVIIVIAVYTGYFDLSGAGLLGTNVAVGTAIGLSGLAASLVGFAINALAAIILSHIIKRVSVEIFGEKLGAIIAAIATLAINTYAMTGGNFFSAITPSNLLKMTMASASSYADVLKSNTQDLYAKSEQLLKDAETKEKEIRDKYIEEFGISDRIQFGNGGIPYAYERDYYESLDEFLNRSQLLGSDISEITLESVSNYVNLFLEMDSHGRF